MGQEKFAERLMEAVRELLPAEYGVEVCKVEKINTGVRHNIVIKNRNTPVSPGFNLEKYYTEYLQKKLGIRKIAEEIIWLYYRIISDDGTEGLAEFGFDDPEKVRKNMVFMLVNHERNRELLEHTAHVDFMDLALIYTIVFKEDGCGTAYVKLSRGHFEQFCWTEEGMYQEAMENTKNMFPACISSMKEIMRQMKEDACNNEGNGECSDEFLMLPDMSDMPDMPDITDITDMPDMEVILNPVSVFCTDLIGGIAKRRKKNLILLPSSRHEMILIEDNGIWEIAELSDMVAEINRNYVASEDVLSDNVYYYDLAKGGIEMYGTAVIRTA